MSRNTPSFAPGQRWISDAEVELGLGTILQCDPRSVTLLFLSSGETRVYATSSAPLTRVMFSEGDQITHQDGWTLKVEDTKEVDGLFIYLGENSLGEWIELPETQIDAAMQLQGPREKLMTGQLDRNNEFYLRALSRQAQTRLAQDPLRGLRGPRVGLIPHQLYIAHEVGRRLAPRVLLADEVGLGKTIEAGLILHQQLVTGRAQRALILVPGSLCHQWLVELLRRFGLPVTLVDADRAAATEAPFADAQIALVSRHWLLGTPAALEQAAQESWDLLIVDEAHHLHWSPDAPSAEYQQVAQLAQQIPGLLLLTATPEQAGQAGFFAQLHLLDPARYPDFEQFQQEEEGYRASAEAIQRLADQQPLSSTERADLETRLAADSLALLALLEHPETSDAQRGSARQQLIEQLLDRYGTGRVLFRNRRASVGGFPERQLHAYPYAAPEGYQQLLSQYDQPHKQMMAEALSGQAWPYAGLYPERLYAVQQRDATPWWEIDPRVTCVLELLAQYPDDKLLVICAHADTVLELSEALRRQSGVLAAVFHEDMPLIERDRAAAWFADEEDGAPLLICSEIGSEGRNFQFAHHLVLFDLPAHPDLLEQRIGRLDRIGQNQTIHLHVPYLSGTPQEAWFAWCDQGLDQFSAPRPVGASLFADFQDELQTWLESPLFGAPDDDDLLQRVEAARVAAEIELEAGRHRLLELASHRPAVSQELVTALDDQEMDQALRHYLEIALDVYRVHNEDLDSHTWYLKPGRESDTGIFHDVHFDLEEGSSGTFLRSKALARDDLHFLTWEHPLTRNCLDAATTTSQGNAAVALLKNPALPAGTLLIEAFYCLEAPKTEGLERYLPPQSVRFLLDAQGNDLAAKVGFKGLSRQLFRLKKGMARDLVKLRLDLIRQLLDQADQLALARLPTEIETAQTRMRAVLDPEVARLEALSQLDPHLAGGELDWLHQQRQQLDQALNHALLRLDAVRVIVAAGPAD